jgi:3alpha(or 20beta)-hydroxysteroid dehydrogenase
VTLAGKLVVVTGAAGGIGAACAALLVERGASVLACDLHGTPERLDVTSPADWAALAARHERVDGLVNAAGVTHRARLDEVALEDWEQTLRVNTTGVLLGLQALVPLMPRGASVVNVGSLAALGAHYPVAYTVSKWALRGLSRVASLELGERGIRVNTVHPGYVETPMTASAPETFRAASLRETPLGRLGAVGDVAPLVAFLLSDESSHVNGAEIPVDGGHAAHGGTKSLSDALR